MDVALPDVEVRLNEDLNVAHQRVLQAFREKGFPTKEIPLDPGLSTALKVFVAPLADVNNVCIVTTRDLSEAEESHFMNTVAFFVYKMPVSGTIRVKGYSPVQYSEAMRYMLSDVVRFRFCVACNKLLNDHPKPTPAQTSAIAVDVARLCGAFGRPQQGAVSLAEVVEHVVMNVLRTEKDQEKENTGFEPTGALVCLGYMLGESVRLRMKEEKNLDAAWVALDDSMLVEIAIVVKKGFFKPAERTVIITGNPLSKVFKLFRSGMTESVTSFENVLLAQARFSLQEKNAKPD